jgi:branched-chain amino acid transport system substrate-binding protein
MKRLALAALFAGTTVFSPFGLSNAIAADPIEIDAILSLTGGAAFLGSREAQSLGVLEKAVNARGGVSGRPIKFVIHDDATNPQNDVELANTLISKRAAAIIGPSLAATCGPILSLVDKAGPVSYCLSSPVEPPPGSFMFSASTSIKDVLPITLRYLKARGWTRVAVVSTTDASGQAYDRSFEAALAAPDGRGIEVVAHEHYNTADVSLLAQIAKVRAAGPQVVLTPGVGPAFATFLRQSYDGGLNLPIVGSSANINAAQLEQYKSFIPKDLFFVSSWAAAPDPAAPRGVNAARAVFYQAFRDAGMKPEYLHTIAWDGAMLIIDAMRKLGPSASAQQIRDHILGQRNWSGILGVYDFGTTSQRGVSSAFTSIYRWDSVKSEIKTLPAPKAQ